jgi:hypothetical protein
MGKNNGNQRKPPELEQTPQHVVGQPFNPSRRICGFYPPDIVSANTELKLKDGQKRLYERGVRWAGQNGEFWHGFKTIAEALGKSVRQVKDDMATLEAKGLIAHVRRRRQPNLYRFLWHPIFEVQDSAHQEDDLKVQDSILEVQDSVKKERLEVQPTALELCNTKNYVKEESSSRAASVQQRATEKTTDDDLPSKKFPKNQHPHPEAVEQLVAEFQQMLRLSKAQTLQVPVEEVQAPDRRITIEILKVFADFVDARTWIEGTIHRALARKSRSPRWGLWLEDAKNSEAQIRLDRKAAEEGRVLPRPPQSSKAENAQRRAEARFLRGER